MPKKPELRRDKIAAAHRELHSKQGAKKTTGSHDQTGKYPHYWDSSHNASKPHESQ